MTDRSTPLIFAHRGVSVEFTENSLEAFRAAGPRRADGVELDVHRAGDGRLVVHHDAHLADGRAIIDLDRAALPETVPTLAESLEACAGLRVNIEIKNIPGEPDYDEAGLVAAGVVTLVREMELVDRVIVSSFNYDDIAHVRALDVDIATGWLVLGVDHLEMLLGHVVADRHTALHPPAEVTTPEVVAAAHRLGILVNTWTVDDPNRIVELAAAGVDAVITNDPAAARSALEKWCRPG
ncbi:MAG TPA: glycerophosphodiester phosphodiesterase [Acidimicrobiales bacterium]|nr:glycerophosphodiester phosphodiesterase [Acidimicrobiales bacterium]